MSTIDDGNPASRMHQPFAALRRSLQEARTADDAERIHVALVDVVDGLIAHVERQARAIDDMRSDLSHKQGWSRGSAAERSSDHPRPGASESSLPARTATGGASVAMRRAGSRM